MIRAGNPMVCGSRAKIVQTGKARQEKKRWHCERHIVFISLLNMASVCNKCLQNLIELDELH